MGDSESDLELGVDSGSDGSEDDSNPGNEKADSDSGSEDDDSYPDSEEEDSGPDSKDADSSHGSENESHPEPQGLAQSEEEVEAQRLFREGWQQRLLFLSHCEECESQLTAPCADVVLGSEGLRCCAGRYYLLPHIRDCPFSYCHCVEDRCRVFRDLWWHYKSCTEQACWVCGPVREKKQQILDQKLQQAKDDQNLLSWLIIHGRECSKPEGQCNYGTHFWEYQELWRHAKDCDVEQCPFPRCLGARPLLQHYRDCELPVCETCEPAREVLQNCRHERQEEEKKRRLLSWLRHGPCSQPEGVIPMDSSCHQLKELREHITHCKLPSCPFPRCTASRSVLVHWETCTSSVCIVCPNGAEVEGSLTSAGAAAVNRLPEDILAHILSWIPLSKQKVALQAVSKQWQCILQLPLPTLSRPGMWMHPCP